MQGAFLGPEYSEEAIECFIAERRIPAQRLAPETLAERVSGLLDEGKVIGWFQGRMEFGPRALGARSILADARSANMQRHVNAVIKLREGFRPFAPSVLRQRVNDFFDMKEESPYMLLVAQVAQSKCRKLTPEEEALEGLDRAVEIASGALDGPVELREGALRFLADPVEGQKTGWYFDQSENRAFVARLAPGGRMLDLYSYAGGFAICAAAAGAREVVAVDRSDAALALGERAAALNGVRCGFVRADAFSEMQRLAGAGETFEVVAADPPSFVNSRKEIKPGLRGYRKLARLAAALVAPGGYLFIASCSYNVAAEAFGEAVYRGLTDAGRSGRVLRAAGAPPDHPRHPALPESDYLKSLVIQLD